MEKEFDQQYLLEKAAKRIWEMAKTDPQLRKLVPSEEVTAFLRTPGLAYRDVIEGALKGYSDREAFGVRDYEVRADEKTGEKTRRYLPAFKTITYGQLRDRILGVASAWRAHPQHRVNPGEMVAFIAFTGSEMATIDLACNYVQAISVPLQANLPSADMETILSDTAPAALVVSIDNLALSVGYALKQQSVRSLIVIDSDSRVDEDQKAIADARARLTADGRIALITFDALVAYGAQHEFEHLPPPAAGRDHVSMVMYTSGSTGTPKGAIIHDAINIQFWSWIPVYVPTVAIAYAPMNHFMGRNMVHGALAQGGTVYFTLKSDMSTFFEDIRLARPTTVLFIPRVCELVYQHYINETQRRTLAGEDPVKADADVRAEMSKTYLGDRLNSGGVGSSPTAPEVRQFMAECFDIPFIEGYGSTEAGGGATTTMNRLLPHVVSEFKLLDVPELNYYTTDRPYPRGELLLKTTLMIKGYFKRPDATAAIYTEDGFLKTGDIMEQRGPDHLVWVDRRNNVIKLSQAEYVAVGPLEAMYLGNSKIIKQIFIYGSSYRSFLLAVVVPDVEVAAGILGATPSPADLRNLVLTELQESARKLELKSFEIPRDVLIEMNPFTLENGLLSSVRKPLRPNLKRRYGDELEAMYQEMDRQQKEELAALRSGESGASTQDRVAGAFKASLGLAEINADDPHSFTDLGGDSLGAVGLSVLFEEMFGVSVPVSFILHPAASAARIAAHVDALVSGAGGGAKYEDVHPDSDVVRASELTLDAFFSPQELAAFKEAAPPVAEIKTVLLTGANGFLGRFMCLEWLEQLSKVNGKLICLVRGGDAKAAQARLLEAFGDYDPALKRRFSELAAKHLEMAPGDLAAPRLGLSEAAFEDLANRVDHIVHPGALVNHVMTYRNLFEPNVRGTAELIRLALTKRQKRFDYVSTVGVPYQNAKLRDGPESMDVRIGAPEMPVSSAYAIGYGASKWAGEVLLRETHDAFGLPVNVFRPNMIMPHSRYVGQFNDTDMMTRLLFSVAKTGLAPYSFYQTQGGGRTATHYDGVAVDILASATTHIGNRPYTGFHSYNTINFNHDDGVSLDSFVDWIESAGYVVQRIADHGEWLRRFADKLRNLPEQDRQKSSLSILGFFEHPHPTNPPHVRTDDYAKALSAYGPGRPPVLNEQYIHKYLHDLQATGFLEAPQIRN